MVIFKKYNLREEVFYWDKSGQFKKGKITKIAIENGLTFSFSSIIGFFLDFISKPGYAHLSEEYTEIKYRINGTYFLESKLFPTEEEGINSIKLFKNSDQWTL